MLVFMYVDVCVCVLYAVRSKQNLFFFTPDLNHDNLKEIKHHYYFILRK